MTEEELNTLVERIIGCAFICVNLRSSVANCMEQPKRRRALGSAGEWPGTVLNQPQMNADEHG